MVDSWPGRAGRGRGAKADLLRSLVVEWLKPSEGPTLRSCVRHMFISARTLLASTLPSSTPHWSKELMPQMKPCKPLRGLVVEVP